MSNVCKSCRKPKANYHCGLCQDPVCKSCGHFVGEESFSYLKVIPKDLTHPTYCTNCFDDKVSGPLEEYNQTLERAREIIIFTKEQSKQTSYLKRKEDPYLVEDCADEQEAIMKMAFYAAQANFNAIIDIKLNSKKIIVGSHKKSIWSGTSIPINIDPDKIRSSN